MLSGGYKDDADGGEEVLYTGQGGQDKNKRQVSRRPHHATILSAGIDRFCYGYKDSSLKRRRKKSGSIKLPMCGPSNVLVQLREVMISEPHC